MNHVIVVLLCYLLGSISFAVLVSAAMGLSDPRTYGSGNPGATNVLRSGNKKAAILTLLGDALKGWLAVWLVKLLVARFAAQWGLSDVDLACAGLAVFLGHVFPIFFRFQGGKGVATAAGVLFAWHPLLGAATLLTWLGVAFVTRYSSLAAICAAVLAPLYGYWLFGAHALTWAIIVMSLLLLWRHQKNIAKLLAGKESKIGSKKATPAA